MPLKWARAISEESRDHGSILGESGPWFITWRIKKGWVQGLGLRNTLEVRAAMNLRLSENEKLY